MDQLAAMRVFRRVVECAGFAAAARDLGLSNAAASKQVAALERALGARLLNRTTRRMSLTEAGGEYYARAVRILDELDEAGRAMRDLDAAPRGRLRVSAPMSLGLMHIARAVPAFLERHPAVELDLVMNDRVVDLVEEGFDMALRGRSQLPDSSLVARRLAPLRRVVCAAPRYLERHGTPASPADLARHECLIYTLSERPAEWRIAGRAVKVHGRLHANNSTGLYEALLAGFGIALMPTFVVGDDLRAGRLRALFGDGAVEAQSLYAVYPQSRYVPAKVRAFIDFLASRLGPEPPWDRSARTGGVSPARPARPSSRSRRRP